MKRKKWDVAGDGAGDGGIVGPSGVIGPGGPSTSAPHGSRAGIGASLLPPSQGAGIGFSSAGGAVGGIGGGLGFGGAAALGGAAGLGGAGAPIILLNADMVQKMQASAAQFAAQMNQVGRRAGPDGDLWLLSLCRHVAPLTLCRQGACRRAAPAAALHLRCAQRPLPSPSLPMTIPPRRRTWQPRRA